MNPQEEIKNFFRSKEYAQLPLTEFCMKKCPSAEWCGKHKQKISNEKTYLTQCAPVFFFDLKKEGKTTEEDYLKFRELVFEAMKLPNQEPTFFEQIRRIDLAQVNEDIKNAILDRKPNEMCFFFAKKLMIEYKFITFMDTEEVYRYLDGLYVETGKAFIQSEFQKFFGKQGTTHMANEVLGHIKRSTFVERKLFEINIDEICLENGIYNLKTKEFNEYDENKFFLTKLPFPYNKDATCPKIDEFIKQVMREKDQKAAYELAGYCLYRDYPIHKAFLLHGEGANGKSTFNKLLLTFLNPENCTSVSVQELQSDHFAIGSQFGKLANIYSDLSSTEMKGTGKFKMLTGGDFIDTDVKFKGRLRFLSYSKQIFSCNKPPSSKDDTDAYFRRWIIIQFPNQFTEGRANKNLIKELTTKDELSGLFNKAIVALDELLTKGGFSNEESIAQIREKYVELSSPAKYFCMYFMEVNSSNEIPKKELFAKFVDWCNQRSLPVSSEKKFVECLKERFGSSLGEGQRGGEGRRERVWIGISTSDVKIEEKDEKEG